MKYLSGMTKGDSLKSILLCIILLFYTITLHADSWENQLIIPKDDPSWNKIKILWDNHWDGKNIDNIIIILHDLENKYNDTIDPYLWISKAYYIKAWWNKKKNREIYFKKAVEYATRAHSIDKNNVIAFEMLIASLTNYADKQYILKHYGEWIEKFTPLPIQRALPELKQSQLWENAVFLWDQRIDINKAKAAVDIFKQIADQMPKNEIAQLWVCRGLYYLGYSYISEQQRKQAMPYYQEGIRYGEKALKLAPHSVASHYWHMLNLARSIQYKSLMKKAFYMRRLINTLTFCVRENPLYSYFGPVLTLGSMISKGGWVTRKAMDMKGITIEGALNALDIAMILYPNYFYIQYTKANIYIEIDRKKEARAILKQLLLKDPNVNPLHSAENHLTIKLSRRLLHITK